jgi:hypothetical protein
MCPIGLDTPMGLTHMGAPKPTTQPWVAKPQAFKSSSARELAQFIESHDSRFCKGDYALLCQS